MKVAIIVLIYNGLEYLGDCFSGLEKLDYPKEDLEIIAVDNCSTEPTVEFMKKNFPEVTLIESKKNLGYTGGNNLGIKYAFTHLHRVAHQPLLVGGQGQEQGLLTYPTISSAPAGGRSGAGARSGARSGARAPDLPPSVGSPRVLAREGPDYFFILNHDTVVEPDFLKKLVKVAESDEKIGIAQPKIMFWRDKTRIQTSGNKINFLGICYSGDYNKKDYLFGEPKEITYASGAGMLVKREVFEKVGLFDEDYFMYHEDVDLGWLARLYGYKILVVPDSVIYHKYSFSRNKKKYFFMERNRWWVILKNYKIGTLILFAPALIIMELGLLGYSLLAGWFGWKVKSYFAVVGGLGKVLKKRKTVQAERVIGDREFVKYLTGRVDFEEVDNLVLRVANVFFNVYFKIVRLFIFW